MMELKGGRMVVAAALANHRPVTPECLNLASPGLFLGI